MFKCTECEKIYDIKPDYCDDCGNDTFVEIAEKANENIEQIEKPDTNSISKKSTIETKLDDIVIEPKIKETIKPKELIKKDFDYLSWGFLGICILISVFIILFAFNPKEDEKKVVETGNNATKINTTNIPSSVDGFWNHELPKAEPKVSKIQPQTPIQVSSQAQQSETVKPPETKNPVIISKNPSIQSSTKPAAKPVNKQTTQQVQKNQPKPQPISQQKPTQTKQSQTIQKPTQATKPTQVQTQQKPAQTTKPATANTQATTKPAQTTTQPVWQAVQQPQTVSKPVQTVDTTALKKELANYKINLRNSIGRKIDFANVIGDGSCTVSFKIDSSGKLINRAFSQQSTNTTLNDAVYKAVMATPSYNPPPGGYKNETMYLKISFYNGNFQISLN